MHHDLHSQFAILTAKIAGYANEGLNLTVGNGLLEEPPTASDRNKLSKNKNSS